MHCKLSVWEFCSQVVLAELFTVRGELWCSVRRRSEVGRGGRSGHGSSFTLQRDKRKCSRWRELQGKQCIQPLWCLLVAIQNEDKLILCCATLFIHPTPTVHKVLGQKLYFKYCRTDKIFSCVKRSRRAINARITEVQYQEDQKP